MTEFFRKFLKFLKLHLQIILQRRTRHRLYSRRIPNVCALLFRKGGHGADYIAEVRIYYRSCSETANISANIIKQNKRQDISLIINVPKSNLPIRLYISQTLFLKKQCSHSLFTQAECTRNLFAEKCRLDVYRSLLRSFLY